MTATLSLMLFLLLLFRRKSQLLLLCALTASTNGHEVHDKISSLFKSLLNQPVAATAPIVYDTDYHNPIMEALGVNEGMISVDVTASSRKNLQDLLSDLTANGCNIQGSYAHMVSAKCPTSGLAALGSLDSVNFVKPSIAKNNARLGNQERMSVDVKRALAGFVTSQGVKAMNVNQVQTELGLNGEGVKIGVLSDSYNYLGGATSDMASGDLPFDGVIVLEEINEALNQGDPGIDEGRAMLQIIHDVAPGAKLYFHSAFNGEANFAAGIVKLAEAGCNIIVDDVYYFDEPMFQDGIITQAVDQVYDMGVAYFSAAGNFARQSWAGAFVDSGDLFDGLYKIHNFNPSHTLDPFDPRARTTIPIYLNTGLQYIILNWDQPSFSASPDNGCQSDYDLHIFDQEKSTSVPLNCSDTLSSHCNGGTDRNVGKDAVEILEVDVKAILTSLGRPNDASKLFSLQIVQKTGADAGLLQLIIFSGDFTNYLKTSTGTSFGHSQAKGGAGVAAISSMATPAYGVQKMKIEGFSSIGGIPKLFDIKGNRLQTPEIRNQPRFTAPDGVYTTFFYRYYPNYSDFPMFFGTSAAAPHAAAVAALLLQAVPSLTPNEIYQALENTAIDINDPYFWTSKGYDFESGHGLVDAYAAVTYVNNVTDVSNLMVSANKNRKAKKPPKDIRLQG